MSITMQQVKELRQRTGAGVLDVKNALVASGGDVEAAIQSLREKGLAKAAKKASRDASEGRVVSYIHGDPGRIGVLLEINCETDFVARTDGFKDLARGITMHIAAANPEWLNDEEVPEEAKNIERETYRAQMADEKKPPEIMEKILAGKLQKWMDERVLLRQPYIRDNDTTVGEIIQGAIAEMGENILIGRFSRFEIGGEK
jgi:elongation factor Ts